MATVKFTLIPVMDSEYYNSFTADEKLKKLSSFIDKFEYVKKLQLKHVIEQLSDFEPRLKFKIMKGLIVFETDKPHDDLRILLGHFIMREIEKIEITKD